MSAERIQVTRTTNFVFICYDGKNRRWPVAEAREAREALRDLLQQNYYIKPDDAIAMSSAIGAAKLIEQRARPKPALQ